MGLMHCESFPVNGVFCAQPQKFSPSKVLLYTVCESSVNCLSTQGQERCPQLPFKSIAVCEPFECVGMNFKKFKVSARGNRYAMVFPDKWPEIYPVADRKAPIEANCPADLEWWKTVIKRTKRDCTIV